MNMTIEQARAHEVFAVVQVRAQDKSYGTRVPQSKTDKGKGASKARFVSSLLRGPSSSKEEENKEPLPKNRKVHKEYGSHNGSEHTHDYVIVAADEEDITAVCDAIDQGANLIEAFEGRQWSGTLDIQARKNETERLDAAQDQVFLERYGPRLSRDQSLALVQAKAKNSFTYVRTQVVITVYSKTERPGFSAPKKEGEFYWTCIKSKYVYTEARIPLAELITLWNQAQTGKFAKRKKPKVELLSFNTLVTGVSKFASERAISRSISKASGRASPKLS